MIPLRPPRRDCLLVAPERQRQELGWLGQALEAFDREEAVDAGKIVAQPCGEFEIFVAVALGRPDFEDNGDHTGLPRTFCAPGALLSVSPLSRHICMAIQWRPARRYATEAAEASNSERAIILAGGG